MKERKIHALVYSSAKIEEHDPLSNAILKKGSKYRILNFEKYERTIDPQLITMWLCTSRRLLSKLLPRRSQIEITNYLLGL